MTLEKHLIGTKKNLKEVCDEISQNVPDEDSLQCLQCVNCFTWYSRKQIRIEDDMPICSFCSDMPTLRF